MSSGRLGNAGEVDVMGRERVNLPSHPLAGPVLATLQPFHVMWSLALSDGNQGELGCPPCKLESSSAAIFQMYENCKLSLLTHRRCLGEGWAVAQRLGPNIRMVLMIPGCCCLAEHSVSHTQTNMSPKEENSKELAEKGG